jgi:cytosine/adenosine deaminase-related metal-dependent hydrolase
LAGYVFLEVRGLKKNAGLLDLEKAISKIKEIRKKTTSSMIKIGLSVHAPYTCHPALIKEAASRCKIDGIPLSIHAAETAIEGRLIKRARVLSVIGRNNLTRKIASVLSFYPLKRSAISYLDSLGVLVNRPFLVHCVHLTDKEISRIAESGCTVVHCPRSNVHLLNGRMPLERFFKSSIPVYLGTDSLASSPSLNILEEADFAKQLHDGMVSKNAIDRMVQLPLP